MPKPFDKETLLDAIDFVEENYLGPHSDSEAAEYGREKMSEYYLTNLVREVRTLLNIVE